MMRRTAAVAMVAAALGLSGACRTTHVTGAGGVPTVPTSAARTGVVPEGTRMSVRLNQPLGAESSRVGDRFTATVDRPVTTTGGAVVVPAGAVVTGRVSQLERSERIGDQAAIGLQFDSIQVEGRRALLEAAVVATEVKGAGTPRLSGKAAGIGAAAGTVLGAIIGGNFGGALLGGLVGAGTGTLIGLGTGEVAPRLPAGTELSLRTTAPVKVATGRGGGTF